MSFPADPRWRLLFTPCSNTMKHPPNIAPRKTGYITNRLCQIVGILLIVAGLVLNEWVIQFLSQGQVKFAELEKRIFLALVELMLVLLGYLLLRYKITALQNLLLVLCSIFFSFGMVEIGLKYIDSNLEEEAPTWIPYKQKMINAQINQHHQIRSRLNPYGFNDKEHPFRKDPDVIRVAVLGDSFIWGVGVEDNVIWTNKLKRLLNQTGMKAEVLNWGKPGWSTLDEFQFLKSEGIRYDFDLLLVGFVVNDPVMDGSMHISFIYVGGIIDRLIIQPLSKYLFPNALSLLVDLANGFFDKYFGYGYANWLDKVYSPENLQQYKGLLKEMSEYCSSRHIRILFVMTPENHHPSLNKRFEQIIGLLDDAGIPYLNLYPEIYNRFHHLPNSKLWANPADRHPGDMVTEVYARSLHQYLLKHSYLPSPARKKI